MQLGRRLPRSDVEGIAAAWTPGVSRKGLATAIEAAEVMVGEPLATCVDSAVCLAVLVHGWVCQLGADCSLWSVDGVLQPP